VSLWLLSHHPGYVGPLYYKNEQMCIEQSVASMGNFHRSKRIPSCYVVLSVVVAETVLAQATNHGNIKVVIVWQEGY